MTDETRELRPREETTLVVQIGNVSTVTTTKNGRLDIQIFDHDPSAEELEPLQKAESRRIWKPRAKRSKP
jgi:hypothetical protein